MSAGHCRVWLVAGVVALLALAGCRDSEQNRPLHYSKGSYQGAPDSGLPADTLEALRQRAGNQGYN